MITSRQGGGGKGGDGGGIKGGGGKGGDDISVPFTCNPALSTCNTIKKKNLRTKPSGTNGVFFHLRRAAFSSMLKSRVGHIMAKASVLRVNLNLDGAPIASSSHTHPSHSQTSRLLTSSLSLSVPVPRPTQCM